MSAARDELHQLVDQLADDAVPGVIALLRELADRTRQSRTLEHYATLAAGWDFEGWERRRAAEKDPATADVVIGTASRRPPTAGTVASLENGSPAS
jgi:hypothetical protein